jgi:hypothetical protein
MHPTFTLLLLGSIAIPTTLAAPAAPIVACEKSDNCPPWINTRSPMPAPEPLRPMDPGNEYLACYWGYIGGKAKRDQPFVEAELEKRCGKAKAKRDEGLAQREAEPEPEPLTDLRNMYRACYAAYISQKVKRGEPVEEAELEKRCGKAKRDEGELVSHITAIGVS